ncbi:(3R)-hydroxymyristoyl-ACP dehydratase [Bordetella ansorpii]|uniref:3-hydroxyacyl-[acyl-carrier-protein] dehydratase FabZ n=1 Tax=Bordetella ansorpii TaxID=288768 RepID=A0A157NJT4_9BORD|nr:3-hydroxyacyl-ACP dehydratase FabZ [Bordetella ansorpii]SAI20979.1 (3R)-hydroxymyristoyl-ACP dehydratase [Bordetella ansorpii]
MTLAIDEILRRLPHRYPMLLIDKVTEIVPRERIVAIKNLSRNEPFFDAAAGRSAMPGMLIVEAIAQAAALFSFSQEEQDIRPEHDTVVYYFLGIDDAQFSGQALPGDQLRLEVNALRLNHSLCKYQGRALVGDVLVAQARILCAMRSAPLQ